MATAPEKSDSAPAPVPPLASVATGAPNDVAEEKEKAVVPVPVVNSNLSFFLSRDVICSLCAFSLLFVLVTKPICFVLSFLSLIGGFDSERLVAILVFELLELYDHKNCKFFVSSLSA